MLFSFYWVNFIFIVGALDPYGLYHSKKKRYVQQIVRASHASGVDPVEALAISLTESNLNPKAYSHTHDAGLFQINCKWWYKKLGYSSKKECVRAMFDPAINIKAGLHVLSYFRKNFKQCRGSLAYRCYNGGQGWTRSQNKHKIINYSTRVAERKKVISKYYKEYIADYLHHITKEANDG